MKLLLTLASVVAVCWSMTTTHAPHTHKPHEPTEHESIGFVYLPKTQNLLIKVRKAHVLSCYVVTLDDQAKLDVHTDSGLRALELKYLQTLSSATAVTVADFNSAEAHACGHAAHNGTTLFYHL